jgi:DNA-binding NtrC family response regulator
MAEKILIVDDEPNITSGFSSLLADEGFHTQMAASAEEALLKYSQADFDLILLDLNLPHMSGIDFLKQISQEGSLSLVMVISGQSDIPTALEAVRLGAVDYLEKPVPPEKLISSVKMALKLAAANRQRTAMVEEIDDSSRIIGNSRPIKKLLQTIGSIAVSEATVLITGENGTGKELVATRLFLQSNRRDKPFVKVNCPGIPPTLFESELFGHRKGAFTGAVRDYPGKFVMADNGTIFLDEIGDLPAACQAKLLRVLENGEVETLGQTDQRRVDVRVLCATNQNLKAQVEAGNFREDLYYRISVLTVEVPALRERLDDVPQLAGEFLKRFDPAQSCRLAPETLAYLSTLPFPGNVRELKNIIERVTILCGGGTVEAEDLRRTISGDARPQEKTDIGQPLSDRVHDFEKNIIVATLAECDGNITRAARALKVDRANLSRKIKDLGLKNLD